jgi:hypothetical protein
MLALLVTDLKRIFLKIISMNVYTLTLYKCSQFYLRANVGIIKFEKSLTPLKPWLIISSFDTQEVDKGCWNSNNNYISHHLSVCKAKTYLKKSVKLLLPAQKLKKISNGFPCPIYTFCKQLNRMTLRIDRNMSIISDANITILYCTRSVY